MALHPVGHLAIAGQGPGAYSAFPADLVTYPLSAWATHVVLLDELAAPNAGMYAGELDDSKGLVWLVFEGAAQPASADEYVARFDLASTAAPAATVAALNADATQVQMQTDAAMAANASAMIKAEVEKIDRAAAPVTPGAPKKKRLVNAAGETLETVHEVLDGDA